MAEQGNFNINVGVIDSEAIAKLKDINKQLSDAQAPLRAYQRELKKFNDLSGRTARQKELQEALGSLKNKFGDIKNAVGMVAKPMLALFGVGSIAGVVGLSKSFADWGNEIRNTSALLGISTQQAIKLSQAGKLLGIGDQVKGLETYQDTQNQIAAGQNAKGQYADNILGITPKMDFQTAELTAVKKANELLKSGKANAAGLRDALKSAGLDANLLGQDPARLAKGFKMAAANAKEMAPYAKQAGKFRDTLAEAGGRIDVLKTKLMAALEPALGPIIQKFIDWSKDNKAVDETMNQIAEAAKQVGEWIKNIKIEDIKKDFQTLKDVAEGVAIAFVALKAISFTRWSVGLVSDITKVITSLTSLGKATGAAEAVAGGGTLATAAVVGGAAVAAGYGVYKGVSEVHHDFFTDKGVMEGRQAKMKDSMYGANRYGTLEKNQKQYEAMNYLVKKKGYTPEQAAATVAQARQEGGFNTQAIGDGGAAIGTFQWHGDRQKVIEKQFGKSIDKMSLEEQLDAYDWEMKNTEKAAGKELFGSKNLSQAVRGGLDYERPKEWLDAKKSGNLIGSKELNNRFAMSQSALSAYTGKTLSPENSKIDLNIDLTHNPPKITQKNSNPNIASVKTRTNGGIAHG